MKQFMYYCYCRAVCFAHQPELFINLLFALYNFVNFGLSWNFVQITYYDHFEQAPTSLPFIFLLFKFLQDFYIDIPRSTSGLPDGKPLVQIRATGPPCIGSICGSVVTIRHQISLSKYFDQLTIRFLRAFFFSFQKKI